MIDSLQMELIRGAEERLVNVWPAVSTLIMDGWVIRFAHGYSGRANSASAIVPGSCMSEVDIAHVERLYHQAGIAPSVRITPLANPDMEPMLLARGYRVKDEAIMMVMELESFKSSVSPELTLEGAASRAWLNGVSQRQEASKRSPEHLHAIVSQIRVPAAFATLIKDEKAIGFGLCAQDRGWAEIGSIMMDADWRGKGMGRTVVQSLLAWAARPYGDKPAASRAFLQVDATNAVAIALYRSLGFIELCRYRTLIKL